MAENMIKICLDAGHGGSDPGACNGSRHEADDVLKLVRAVGDKLFDDYSNVKVYYTRTTDIYESVSKKAADANGFDADYFFSFHRNSASATANGYETLVYANTGLMKEIANDFNKAMTEIGFRNRGTKERTNLAVLKRTTMPSWLLEVGFISNVNDNKLFDEKFDKIVDAIVKVIAENTGLTKKVVEVKPTPVVKPVEKPTVTQTTSKLKVSANVKEIQIWLNKYYNTKLKTDGIYGANTKKALIKAWQKEVGGLTVDGDFGAKSKEKSSSVILKKGSKGILVTILQATLTCQGYSCNGIDGDFGSGCHKAVIAFQKKKGLTQDGVVGKGTWSKLYA